MGNGMAFIRGTSSKAIPVLLFALLWGGLAQSQSPHAAAPNVLLIVVDDLGYHDLAYTGNNAVQTPHMDAIAQQGIFFAEAYTTSPICGPSRQAIFTGRYPQRFGNEYMPYDNLHPSVAKQIRHYYQSVGRGNEGLNTLKPNLIASRSNFHDGLPSTEITLAELLHKQGYATGMIGKWNIGVGDGFYPDQRGFDYSYYFEAALTRYVDHRVDQSPYAQCRLPYAFSDIPAWAPRWGSTAIRQGRQEVIDSGYLTFSLAQKACDFIGTHAMDDRPFFLTLAFNAPHDPFEAPKVYVDKISGVQDSVKRIYYAMIEALDDAVGSVMKQLEKSGLTDNTMVVFVSDNGGASYTRATTNAPLRGGKCTQFDGGLKVPMFMRLPKGVHAQIRYDNPVSTLDIFSTIAAATQSVLPADRKYDGVNLLPYLQAPNDTMPHHSFYWRNGYAKAIRSGKWKLYSNVKDRQTYLFDLQSDPGETTDLRKQFPTVVQQLKAQLAQWEKSETVAPRWPSAASVIINVNGEWVRFPT